MTKENYNNTLSKLRLTLTISLTSIYWMSSGQEIGKHFKKSNTDFKANAVSFAGNNHYYLCGSLNSPKTSTFSNAYIAKLDANGNPIFQKDLNISSFKDAAFDATKTSDGGMLVVGYAGHRYNMYVRSNNGISPTTNDADIFISKYSSAGNLLFQKTIGTNLDDYAYSVTQKSFLEYYVAGNSYSNAWGVMNISLSQISEFGAVMGHSVIETAGINKKSYNTKKIIKLSNGSFIILADEVTDGESETNLGHPREKYEKYRKARAIQLVMLNNSGAITLCKRITFEESTEITSSDIIQTNEGDLIITGTIRVPDQDVRGFVLKTTALGDILSVRGLRVSYGNSIFPASILYNGTLLQIVGYYGQTYQSYGDFWVSLNPSNFTINYSRSFDFAATGSCLNPTKDSILVSGTFDDYYGDRISFYKVKFKNSINQYCSSFLSVANTDFNCVSTTNSLVKTQVTFQETSLSINTPITTDEVFWCNNNYEFRSLNPTSQNEPDNSFKSGISVFPNPAVNKVTVQFQDEEEKVSYTLYNSMGELVTRGEEKNVKALTIDITGNNGFYFLNIVRSGNSHTIKITKQQ